MRLHENMGTIRQERKFGYTEEVGGKTFSEAELILVAISWWQAIFIGIVEGLTEYLPVSSTAHMEVVPQLIGMPDPGAAFSAIIQMGAGVAILLYFWKDLLGYARAILRTKSPANVAPLDEEARMGWSVLFASLPILIVGYLLRHLIEGPFRSLYVVATALIVMGLIILLAEKVGKQSASLEEMTGRQSQLIGWAQCLALVPGVSRSGATIMTGLFLGLKRESAARFSFLLSVPPIMAAGLYELAKEIKHTDWSAQAGPYILGTLVAGITAYAVTGWFLGYVRKRSFLGFVLYRIALGLLILGLLQMGYLKDSATQKHQEQVKIHPVRHSL